MELSGEQTLSSWKPTGRVPKGFSVDQVVLGPSGMSAALEVVVLKADAKASISREALSAFHAARDGKRGAPVIIAAAQGGKAWLFGPNANAAPVGPLALDQAERLLQTALDEPSSVAARQRLAELYEALADQRRAGDENVLPGVANSGLFATHELRQGTRARDDWAEACEAGRDLAAHRRQELLEALGFTPRRSGPHALVLVDGATSRAVAVLLDEDEHFDSRSTRFQVSPVAHALSVAQNYEVPWVVLLRGSQIRLYAAQANLGVGRKGLAETYLELDLALVTDETFGYLPLIFSAGALGPAGTVHELLAASSQYAVALGERLRDQVYEEIVPRLSVAVANQLEELGHELDRDGLERAYQLTLRIFFRLLFQAYAEDRQLLPYRENERYDRNALNTYAQDFVEEPDQVFDPNSSSIWDDLKQVWHVIDKGDAAWSVPAYNGGLFGGDPDRHPDGALIEAMVIANDVMGPVLQALLIDRAEEIVGPIDFRSLGVREFGTIYEGLLESSLGIAETDLVLDESDMWVQAAEDSPPSSPDRSAPAGTIYFHNTSGQRKGTGSYFTPLFVVEHLVESALVPALDEHLARVKSLLDDGDQAGAADAFFDFRVADIAMGSGHFLTTAIDYLEAGMAAFLESNPIPGVRNELNRLADAARAASGPDAPDPEPSSLLRRQVARRCVYGLDINPIAVELARVSIWIHTFVRGLPMSSLDHNLVCADSLTGIATVPEALDALVPGRRGAPTLFDQPIEDALHDARRLLVDAARLAEVDRAETQASSRAATAARDAAEQASLLFDAATLLRLGHDEFAAVGDVGALMEAAAGPAARREIEPLRAAYFPAFFPEVMLREQGGFDVLLGNPPWDELHVNADKFWVRYFPGHMSRSGADKERLRAEYAAARPDLAAELQDERDAADHQRAAIRAWTSSSDLYQAFLWRYLELASANGHIGVVMPRGATIGAALGSWRSAALAAGTFAEVLHCINKSGWIFPDVHQQTQIVLLTMAMSLGADPIETRGIATSRESFHAVASGPSLAIERAVLDRISPQRAIPAVPGGVLADSFLKMREAPSLGELTGHLAVQIGFDGAARVVRAATPASVDADGAAPVVQGRHVRLWEVPEPTEWIFPPGPVGLGGGPGIVFRKLARPDDSRTFICSPSAASTFVKETAYWVRADTGDPDYTCFLLGVLSSRVFDWYVRRLVDRHILPSLASTFPVPLFDAGRDLHHEIVARTRALLPNGVPGLGLTGTSVGNADVIAQVDGLVAHAFSLPREALRSIYEHFHPTFSWEAPLDHALEAFDGAAS